MFDIPPLITDWLQFRVLPKRPWSAMGLANRDVAANGDPSFRKPRTQKVRARRPQAARAARPRPDVRFARPNIQIFDTHAVDLYQLACARYLVGVKGTEDLAERVSVNLR